MAITTVNISLPDELRDFVSEQVTEGGYSTTSEYFRQLIRLDQKRRAKENLERLMADGIGSGPSKSFTDSDWREMHDELDRRLRPSS